MFVVLHMEQPITEKPGYDDYRWIEKIKKK